MKVAVLAKARNGHLIQYRQKYKITQTVAAKYAEVSMQYWCALECMRFKDVPKQAIAKIADHLGVHPDVIAPPELSGKNINWKETAFADLSSDRLLELRSQTLVSYKELPDTCADQKELVKRIEEGLTTLSYREREVLKLRFGIGNGFTHTLKEIGEIFKVTKDRIRVIQNDAIRKLQHPTRSRQLESFLPDA